MPTRVMTNAIYDALTREKIDNNESNSKPITGVMRLLVCGDYVAVGTNDRPLWSDENWFALIRHLGQLTLTEISGNERSCYDFLTKREVGAGLHQVTPLVLKEGRVDDSELGLTLVKATTVTDPNTNEVTELMSSVDMTYNMMTGWIKKISTKIAGVDGLDQDDMLKTLFGLSKEDLKLESVTDKRAFIRENHKHLEFIFQQSDFIFDQNRVSRNVIRGGVKEDQTPVDAKKAESWEEYRMLETDLDQYNTTHSQFHLPVRNGFTEVDEYHFPDMTRFVEYISELNQRKNKIVGDVLNAISGVGEFDASTYYAVDYPIRSAHDDWHPLPELKAFFENGGGDIEIISKSSIIKQPIVKRQQFVDVALFQQPLVFTKSRIIYIQASNDSCSWLCSFGGGGEVFAFGDSKST